MKSFKLQNLRHTTLALAAALGFGMGSSAFAGSGTWKTVATDGLWHNTSNWSAGSIPNASTDIAIFNSGSNFTTISIGSTTTTVDSINFPGASAAGYTFTGTASTNLVLSTNNGGVFIDSAVTTDQDLSGIPIIRPGMGDTINFSNQGSGSLKLGTFQAENVTGSLSTVVFKPGTNGNIEVASGKLINNAGTGSVKKIAIVLDDVGTLKIAAIGSYDGSNTEGNSVSIRQGTLQAAVIKNSGTSSSLGGGGRIQFGKASTTNTATLDYYGATDTTDRVFHIIDNNTAVFKVSGGAATNLTISSAITESAAASDGGKLTKTGTGKLTLTNTNSYSGATSINAGTLALGAAGSIAASSPVNIAAGATLDTTAQTSYPLPSALVFGLDGGAATSGQINATGKDLVISGTSVTFSVSGSLTAPAYVLATYATKSGTAFASVSPPSGYTVDYAYNSGTQIALVPVAPGYASWISRPGFGLAPADQDASDDPDNDGTDNLLEFVLNGNPSASDPAILPALDVTATDFVFTFTRRLDSATGSTQSFECGTDLSDWATIAPLAIPAAAGSYNDGKVVVGPATGSAPDETQAITITIPKGAYTTLFGRLQVTQP